MRRNLFLLLTLLGLIAASACSTPNAAQEQATATPLPTIASAKATFTVQRGDILSQEQFSARVIPMIQEQLSFRADGRVRRLYVRPGDPVTQGQLLADLVQVEQMQAQKKQQVLDLRRAQINLEMAQLRAEAMKTQTPSWELNYEITMRLQALEVELAQIDLSDIEQANTTLDAAIGDAQVVSPIDGKILKINIIEGAEIQAYSVVIIVGDDTNIEIGAELTSDQMKGLAEGMPATIELPLRPGEKLQGKVRSLPYPFGTGGDSPAQQPAGALADATTRISLDNAASLNDYKLGDIVSVVVTEENKPGVLWLPLQAIRTYDGRTFVVVQTDGLPRRVDVRIGIKNDEKVEIISGVEEGQVVIAP